MSSLQGQRKRRFAILGCKSVGKTSLTVRFAQKTFFDQYVPTIEDTMIAELSFQGRPYQIEVADSAGQENGSPASTALTLNVDGWILVFSTADTKSFQYLSEIRNGLVESTGYMDLPMVLVGNKVDLEGDRQVTEEEVTRLAQRWNCPAVFTSAKTNQNVQDVFMKCLREVERANGDLSDERKCTVS